MSRALTYDPGVLPAGVAGTVALAGLILSFLVRRRRLFVRAEAGPGGGSHVTIGGLARSDAAGGFETEFTELAGLLSEEQQGTAGVGRAPPPAPPPPAATPPPPPRSRGAPPARAPPSWGDHRGAP